MSLERERRAFLDFLRDRGHRVTAERRALFDEVFSRHGALDAEQLLAALRERGVKISRATVYRNLELLVQCGLVRRHHLGRGGSLRYEHVHPGQRLDHLACRQCGRVVEFVSPPMHSAAEVVCEAHEFLPDDLHFSITGLCTACRREGTPARPAPRRRPPALSTEGQEIVTRQQRRLPPRSR